MRCPFCKSDIKEWDKKVESYVIATKNVSNEIHVHATFDKPHAIQELSAKINSYVGSSVSDKNSVCQFCGTSIGDGNENVTDHLVVTKNSHNHIHVHGPLEKKEVMEEFVDTICGHAEISSPKSQPTEIITKNQEFPKRIVLHNRQAIGDILTMTAAVRDTKAQFPDSEIGVITTAMHIWDNNPHVNFELSAEARSHAGKVNEKESCVKYIEEIDSTIAKIGPGFLTNRSNTWNYHMCNAYRMDIEQKLGVKITQGATRPDIWLTEEEYNRKPLIEGEYWVIIVGGEPGWPVKMYPQERWQEVVDTLKDKIQFVQLGVKSHPWPHLENVIDYIGKTEDKDTGIRDLFNIFLHSQGSVSLVSMAMHLSAAFQNPAVVLAGAREPSSFTQYFGHQYLQTNGCLLCSESTACWKCKLEGCKQIQESKGMDAPKTDTFVPKCVDLIKPSEVVAAIEKYYEGGRLVYGKKIPNKLFKNIVKESKTYRHIIKPVEPIPISPKIVEEHGFEWGGGSITDRDWEFIQGTIKKYNVKTVLEFGAGLSTILMSKHVNKIKTYETIQGWINKIEKFTGENSEIIRWDGIHFTDVIEQYDMAFVDGPSGGENREWSTKIASESTKIIIVHDAGRVPERKWQEKYLSKDFVMTSKGGHRCHLWVHNSLKEEKVIEFGSKDIIDPIRSTKGKIKIAFNGRGMGGAERSVTWIANTLYDMGYNVIYHSPSGVACGTFREEGNKNIPIKDYTTIDEECDILFWYANDSIWTLNKNEYEKFSNLRANRKVMGVNYKVGGIGKIDWTKNFDYYLFLNSELCNEVKKRIPGVTTCIMAPPTPIEQYLRIVPDYNLPIRIARHSSQGDVKYPRNFQQVVEQIISCREDIILRLMPKPSFFDESVFNGRVIAHLRNKPSVPEFLALSNCFNYIIPNDYTEGGPKTVIEALAAGIPVITHNRSGMKDRVAEGTGWLCDSIEEMIEVIKGLTPEILKERGTNAKEYAKQTFIPERWIEEILN